MKQPVKVLVVEDDPSLREIIEELLIGRGLDVTTATRGEEAVEIVRTKVFDLIVSDIRMDGISGLDAIEQAREIQPGLGSIVVSGYASEEETLRAVKLNVAGYLKKPFELQQLMQLINDYLRKKSEQEKRERELSSLRELLSWSLQQQATFSEELGHGPSITPARLARELAYSKRLDRNSARELFEGTLLRSLTIQDQAFPKGLLGRAFKKKGLLHDSAQGEGLSGFAISVCETKEGSSWPAPSELDAESDPADLAAYQEFLAGDQSLDLSDSQDEESHERSLLHARNLELIGNPEDAEVIYQRICADQQLSLPVLKSRFGLARICAAQGRVKELEQEIKALLDCAGHLGPATTAESSFEAAMLLKNAGHTVAGKLLERASKQLKSADRPVLWAVSVLCLQRLVPDTRIESLTVAAETLCKPEYLPDLLERSPALIPDLLELTDTYSELESLTALLLRHYGSEIENPGKLTSKAKFVWMKIAKSESIPLTQAALEQWKNDSDPAVQEKLEPLAQAKSGPAPQPLVKLSSLGGFLFEVADKQLTDKDWRTQKTKFLFARLAEAWPRPVAVDRLYEDFWPGAPEKAKNNFNTSMSFIRSCFKKVGLPPELLERHGSSVGLSPQLRLWHDWTEFRRARASAQSHRENDRAGEAIAAYNRMTRLYNGSYLEDCYLNWAVENRHTAESQLEEAYNYLMVSCFEQKRFREAVECSRNALGRDLGREKALEILMRSYLSLNHHDKAMEVFEQHRDYLKVEFGTEPSIELEKYYQMARYQLQDSQGIVDI